MSKISDRIAQLSPEKRELLLQKLQLNQKKTTFATIQPQSRDTNTFPLSFAQERLWFLNQLEPNNAFYNQPVALRLTGELKLEVLKQALSEIIRRHESLRTNFTILDGKTLQTIQREVNFEIPTVDLTSLSSNELEIQKLAEREAKKPFNLERDLLLRATLLKLSISEHVVLFTTHHIISDGWSKGILIQELATLYQAFLPGKPSPLPELSIQYADYAVWQRNHLQGEILDAQLSYWQQQLGNNRPILNLPTDYSRPKQLTYQGATESFVLDQSLTKALKTLCQKEGVTLFMTLLAAFQVLLHRYSHQDDIIVGTPIANRNREEIEGLIGFFVNTLVLRNRIDSNSSFRDFLKQVKEVTLGAYTHQDLPFEQLVEELKLKRHLNRNPLFDVMFILQNAPETELRFPGLTLSSIDKESQTAKFDLSLNMSESSSGLVGIFEYSTDLFKPSTIKRAIGHFKVILEAIVAQPETPISQLPLLTENETQQFLVEWNDTEINYPQDECIHTLFEAQVEKTPETVAVVFENQQLTYQELNAKANQLAHHLQKLGVKPEVKVGICVERSIEMVIALLAILKAGGTYIPLDPSYPPERISFILEEAKVSLILSEQQLLPLVAKDRAKVICLDRDCQKIKQQNTDNPIALVTPDNLAYVIYTSGSTGKPKGVQITHTAVVNFLTAMSQTPGLMTTEVLLAVTTISFDIAALEIYLPLIVGARLVLASRELATDANQLSQQLASSQANVMQATPATWRMLIDTQWQGNRNFKILCGGEALDRCLADRLLSRSKEVWNLYGPTETTIWSAVHRVNGEFESTKNIIPIGRPITNTQFYVLDQYQQLVPVGVVGELYIGGQGLARGYFGRDRLTAERFISHSFGENQLRRLYKTGDLVRWQQDGQIEYIGRIDHQVKIRGFRIELGEIEAILGQHPQIKQCVVIAGEDKTGDKKLIAYYISEERLDPKRLREYLRPKLPEYMIPLAWVKLETLPLTPNGKVDRKAFPIPDQNETIIRDSYIAPSTPTEEILASIWQQVLNLERVSIKDNFFELGGHSLLATQVVSKMRESLSVELPLRSLFESPTIAELAREVKRANAGIEILTIKPVAREGNTPLSFAQQRLWFLAQLEPDNRAYNLHTCVYLSGSLNIAALSDSINEIVKRHEILRTSFTVVDGQPIQKVAPISLFTLTIINLSECPPLEREKEVHRLAIQESLQPFDLGKSPLLRMTLMQLDREEHIILLTMHHIISDAWSMGVFVEEIAALYSSFCARKPSTLSELNIQYADFAVWQRQWLQGKILQTQLDYWKQQLGSPCPRLSFSNPSLRSSVETNRGAKQSFTLSKDLTEAIDLLSRQEGVTLFMTMLAVFQVLLHCFTGTEDIRIGSPIANRNRAEIENLIGFFVNTLVLRIDLSGNPSFRELLVRSRQVTLEAYAHQDLPFEKLVEELQPERSLNHHPLYQAWFVLQNAPMPKMELPDITLTPFKVERDTVRHDLLLAIWESSEGLKGKFEYKTDLFYEASVSRLIGHFTTLVQRIVAQPDTTLHEIATMLTQSDEEQQKIQKQELQVTERQKLKMIKRKTIRK